mgnify:FL=1
MTFVIQQECVGVKDAACVEVCPVDCIYEADPKDSTLNLPMFINPDECIDCFACQPECPVEAIYTEDDADEKWLKVNAVLAEERDELQ